MSSDPALDPALDPADAARAADPCRACPPLRLLAQDLDDLRVISAALQDAVLTPADIRWEQAARRLTVTLNRFRWEAGPECARVLAALQLGDVLSVKSRRLPRGREAPLELLALEFEPAEDPPGGFVTLMFAAGGDLRVEVECVDAVLTDLSQPWRARQAPCHERGGADDPDRTVPPA